MYEYQHHRCTRPGRRGGYVQYTISFPEKTYFTTVHTAEPSGEEVILVYPSLVCMYDHHPRLVAGLGKGLFALFTPSTAL